jgi:transcription initiation factor TFIIH subunit 4
MIKFLFLLSCTYLGMGYSIETLNVSQRAILQDLTDLGLIYQIKGKPDVFFSTSLGLQLMNLGDIDTSRRTLSIPSSQKDLTTTTDEGFLIIEANYRVYAYTQSPLQIAILSLFVDLQYRFANMAVGLINRESIRHALLCGITADQIIHYLTTHVHPQMRNNSPTLPSTLCDQIKLWELERNRMQLTPAVMYDQFATQKQYEEIKDYADQLAVTIYSHPERRLLVVLASAHDQIRNFIKRRSTT